RWGRGRGPALPPVRAPPAARAGHCRPWRRRCAGCRSRLSAASKTGRCCSTCAASMTKRASSPTSPASILRRRPMGWLDALVRRPSFRDKEASVVDRMAAAYAAAERGDHAGALAIWGPLAQAGVARAQNNVGACFAEGLGVERDATLAAKWLSLAAAAGDAVGRRNLAALYFKGEGVAQDYGRAAELYRAAADQGDGSAQDMLSWMLLEGEVAAADYGEARRWAEAAAA